MKRFDHINVIPFIDIMLVMLAIVLTTASFISQGSLDINVPVSTNTVNKAVPKKQISIALDKNKNLFFQQKKSSLFMFEQELIKLPNTIKVMFKVDKDVPFQSFVHVLDVLKKQHFQNLSIVTEKVK